jgi:transposase
LKYESGLNHRSIARACGIGVGTVSLYVRRAETAGLVWPLPADLDDTSLEAVLFPHTPPSSVSHPMPDYAHIHQELKRPGVTLQLLWEEYREEHPCGYGYSRFCELYNRWRKKLKPSMRQHHRAGEKTFIDFSGKKPHYIDPGTGELIEAELFVAVLGASNYSYAEATESQELRHWIKAHTRMARFFGGSSEIWVPDNLKSGITKPCRYEAEVNRTYQNLAEHYGAVVIPARVRKPKDKAKVEVGVQVVQRWILARLRNRTFFSLAELNQGIAEEREALNNRPMQKLGVSRREQFERLDRPALKPLPREPYVIRSWAVCKVNIDYHIELEHNLYSVPYQLMGEKVEACYTQTTVEILNENKRITTHQRLYGRGKRSTKKEHMPSSHRAHAEWTPSRVISWARKNGSTTAQYVEEIMRRLPHPEQGFRSCLGIIRLGKRYGAARLENACRRATELSSYSFRTIKNILTAGMDRLPLEEEPCPPPTPEHDNIRGAEYYAEKESLC